MSAASEMKKKFWTDLKHSPFVMLGLSGVDRSHSQPMAAQFDETTGHSLYFYTNRQNRLVDGMGESHDAFINYASSGHDLFMCGHGRLVVDQDPAIIERFWSPFVSAWYENGKDDTDLTLIRLDLKLAEIWNASTTSFLKAMAVGLFGGNAEQTSQDDVVTIRFG